MKANELQIGDYVNYRGQIIKVTSLYDKGGSNEVGWSDKESVWVNGRCIEPIPLTPEILKKNGFKPYIPENHLETVYACQDVSKAVADELYALWPYQDGSFYLLLRVDGKDMVRMDVHYIHQLQHAFRFCGITREIIL